MYVVYCLLWDVAIELCKNICRVIAAVLGFALRLSKNNGLVMYDFYIEVVSNKGGKKNKQKNSFVRLQPTSLEVLATVAVILQQNCFCKSN